MPKPKSYRGRAIGMVGATIAMGALTIMSVKRGVKETIRLKQDSQKFEQRFEQLNKNYFLNHLFSRIFKNHISISFSKNNTSLLGS